MIENCHSASTELRNILFKLAIDDVIKNNNVHLRIRVRRVKEYWKQPEIDRLLSKFGDYEKQLVKSTLAHVSNCPIPDDLEYEGSFRNGYHNRGKIVDILAVAEEFLSLPKGANGQPRPDSGDAVGIHEAIFTGQPVTAMAAVLTFQNGDTKFLTRKGIKDQDQASKGQVLMNLRKKILSLQLVIFDMYKTWYLTTCSSVNVMSAEKRCVTPTKKHMNGFSALLKLGSLGHRLIRG